MDIASFIRHVPDYPKPGILFYDITPLLASPEAFGDVIERMADAARPLRPTRIVAAEARGFLFAAPLAQRLGVGLAPVRKPGKLPCEAFEASYDLEYGSNNLCLHKDALTPEDRVLIVDDILATGGTLDAMIRLVGLLHAHGTGCPGRPQGAGRHPSVRAAARVVWSFAFCDGATVDAIRLLF